MCPSRIVVIGLFASAMIAPAADLPKVETRSVGVVNYTSIRATGQRSHLFGIVAEVDDKSMTLCCTDELDPLSKPPKEYQLYPVQRLAEGKLLDQVDGTQAYLWHDVKKGDTIIAATVADNNERKRYCVAITITRRPGDVLPKSQITKHDETRYGRDNLLNDIENRKDVDDADIEKFFGTITYKHPEREAIKVVPGGLPRDYQVKLDAIRAKKKEGDLKATPPKKK